MFRPRRRPLMRAAMVGGAGYVAGKKTQQGREREAEQEARIADLEAQQAPAPVAAPPAPAPAPAAETDVVGELTPEEFEAAKRKVLG